MKRNEFFSIAQMATIYTKGFKNLDSPAKNNLLVMANDVAFYPMSVEIGYNENGEVVDIAKLRDTKTNSVISIQLERVEKYV